MRIERIEKELDQILSHSADVKYCQKMQKNIGRDYKVFGLELDFLSVLIISIHEMLETHSLEIRFDFLKKLTTSEIFEKKWIGFRILFDSYDVLQSLTIEELMEIRPKEEGVFRHVFTYHILPKYLKINVENMDLISRLMQQGSVEDQVMAVRALLVMCNGSKHFQEISKEIIKTHKILKNNNLQLLVERLQRRCEVVDYSIAV